MNLETYDQSFKTHSDCDKSFFLKTHHITELSKQNLSASKITNFHSFPNKIIQVIERKVCYEICFKD